MSSSFVISTFADRFANYWHGRYKEKPGNTITVTVILSILVGTGVGYMESLKKDAIEKRRLTDKNYSFQIQKLEETKIYLQSLLQFVEQEKLKTQAAESALQELKAQHDQLKPIVALDQQGVKNLLAAQEARNTEALKTERWINIAIGAIGSLLATLLIYICSLIHKKFKADKST